MALNYEEFKEAIVDQIRDFLPDKFSGSEIAIHQVMKNNVALDGLTIQSPDVNITPTIYLNSLYENYQKGEDLDSILKEIAAIRVENEVTQDFKVSQLMDFDQVKDHIMARLVGMEHNAEFLAERPYTQVEDLAVTYHVELGESRDGTMSMPITNVLMEHYGISVEELHDIALANTAERMPAKFDSLANVMKDILMNDIAKSYPGDPAEVAGLVEQMTPDDDGGMWVLTNESKLNGAIALLNPDAMDMVAEKMGTDQFYILPSSIHETLILPKDDRISLQELEEMVQSVNASEVLPQEQLSDHVYAYDVKEHDLYRADHEAEHFAEKAAKAKEQEKKAPEKKTSLKERMEEKKKEIAKKNTREKAEPKKSKNKNKDVSL